jgi:hypothetical protein
MATLNKSVALLYGIPSKMQSLEIIFLNTVFCAVGILIYMLSGLVHSIFYTSMVFLMLFHAALAIRASSGNLLFLFRYFLAWILAFAACISWALHGGEILVAPFGPEYQTSEATRTLIFGGFLSLSGSLFGWALAIASHRTWTAKTFTLPDQYKRKLRNLGVLLSMGFGGFYLYKTGGILDANVIYYENARDIGFDFGVFNVFHFLGVGFLLIAGTQSDGVNRLFCLVSIASLGLGLLSGSRADYLPQAFILFMVMFNQRIVFLLERKKRGAIVVWLILAVCLVVVGFQTANFVAIWRTGVNISSTFERMSTSNAGSFIVSDKYGHKMLYLETGNMMLGGMYAAIHNASENGFLLGKSYLNYFLALPPAFLDFPRPKGLEWATEINGVLMSQGGILEYAESYWNFGFAGCFAISLLISYIFGWLLITAISRNNIFFLTWYLVFGFMSFRAVWYQNFSYFRIASIMVIIYVVAKMLFNWFVTSSSRFPVRRVA